MNTSRLAYDPFGNVVYDFEGGGCSLSPQDVEVVFICGPYRAETKEERQKNINTASEAAKKWWKYGQGNFMVFCPHLNSANFDGILEDEEFLNAILAMVDRSTILVALPGYENSSGAKAEHDRAKYLGKTIIYYQGE